MKEKIKIINKSQVRNNYHYWDTYRYNEDTLWRNAIAHYLHIGVYEFEYTLFKHTIHVRRVAY